MKPQPDHFDDLQALLASKRHVQPPAKFMDRFSERVKDRIEHPEPPGPLTWRQRLGLDADWKPAIMCAWGVALCASLLIGIIVSLNLFQQHAALIPGTLPTSSEALQEDSPFGSTTAGSQAPLGANNPSSTDPVFILTEKPIR